MFLSNASLKRPIAMSCLIIGLTLLGLNAFRTMGLELMPKMDIPYITVVTVYPGASPTEIETDVAKRIEDAVGTIDGLKHVTSSCMENVCQTLLEFQLHVDVDIAATDVREKLDLIRADLPEDVEDPTIQKFDVNAKPIITLALTGDGPLDALYDYADNTLRDRLTVISGVADVELVGGAEREVHIALDRQKLASRGLSSMDVVRAVREGVRTIPSGRVQDSGTEYSVKFDAEYSDLRDLGSLEIANRARQRVYLRDIGSVRMDTEELRQKAFIDGRPCVSIRVVKKADANAVRVADGVRERLQALHRNLPGGMQLVWVTDDGRFIEATNLSAWLNVVEGILLTAAILFFFLYNLRSLLVVAVTMPLTILIGLFFMNALDYTLNTSTLIAIGMSVGILVTNSIVVLEAIVKRLEATGDPHEAARLGAGEAAVAVVASAGTNVVVLFPLAAMPTRLGLFIAPLAMTMFIMTLASLFISFTLTPILCSLLLKPRGQDSRSVLLRLERGWNRLFDRLVGGYRRLLGFNERHRLAAILVLVLVAGMLVHAMALAGTLGTSLAPDVDKGEIYVKVEFPTRYDLALTTARLNEVAALLEGVPHTEHTLMTVGKVEGIIGQSSEGVYLSQFLVTFGDKTERETSLTEIAGVMRARLAAFPEAVVTVSIPSLIGGQSTPIEFEISGPDLATLDRLALSARDLAAGIRGVLDPDTSVREGKPELRIYPRRAVLSDLGASAVGLGLSLRANLEGITAGTYKKSARNYDIVVKLEDEPGKHQVDGFQFPGAPGHPVVLASLARVRESLAPILITRKDKQRISRMYANLDPFLPLGTAAQRISAAVEAEAPMPPGYDYTFAGLYEVVAEGLEGFAEAGIIAVVLVILALAAILESFKQPIVILVTIPLAVIGTVWALALGNESFGMFVIMGMVMMIGIVVNNAILIVDQLNVHIAEGIPRHKAMITAAGERFRPIVMITLAAVLGMLPLALGRGMGAEFRNGVGTASAGGILVSGILTLLVVPIIYDLFTRKSQTPA